MSHLRYNIFYTSDNKHEGSVNMQNYCFEKKIKRAIAGLLFLLFVFGAVLINLPTAWAQEPSSSQEDFGDAQAAAPSQTASDAPSDTASAEPTAEPSGGQEPAPSAAPSSEVSPSESQEPAPSSWRKSSSPRLPLRRKGRNHPLRLLKAALFLSMFRKLSFRCRARSFIPISRVFRQATRIS